MSMTPEAPRALVVYESMFLNTEKVAEGIAEGLRRGGWDATASDVRWAGRTPSHCGDAASSGNGPPG
jgi:flavorubredoxin